MNRWRPRAGGAGPVPLCGLVLLPLLALAGLALIGSQGLQTEPDPSNLKGFNQAALPGMGATILPRWTLGNFDPRLEGSARGEEWPVPAGISYSPDRSTTLTEFPRRSPGDRVPRLLLVSAPGEGR
jgi:hypothetical protein